LCGPDPAFQGLAPLIRWFCAGVIPLAGYQLVLLYQLSTELPGTLVFEAVLVVLYAGGLFFFHADGGQVVACLSAVSACALAGGLAMCLRRIPGAARGKT